MIEYSHLIDHMLDLLNKAKHSATEELHELHKKLSRLRLYSDTARLIAYPTNPNNCPAHHVAKQKERDRYFEFRKNLAKAAQTFLRHFGESLTKTYFQLISELKHTKHLTFLDKDAPRKDPIRANGVIQLRPPDLSWRAALIDEPASKTSKPKP